MAAHLVHEDDHPPGATLCGQLGNALVQFVQHDGVVAFTSFTVGGLFELGSAHLGNSGTDPLAARLVVDPQHRQSGMLQHVHQGLVVAFSFLVVFLAQMREHARQRCCGAGATGPDVAKAENVFLGQPWRGVAFIAIDAKVARAGSFADHHDEGRWRSACGQHQSGVLADGFHLAIVTFKRLRNHSANGIEAVEWIDQVTQLGVVAHDRSEVLVNQQQTDDQDGQ